MRFLLPTQIHTERPYLAMDVATTSDDIFHLIFYLIEEEFLRSELPSLKRKCLNGDKMESKNISCKYPRKNAIFIQYIVNHLHCFAKKERGIIS